MMLTSLQDNNLDDCGCDKRKKLRETLKQRTAKASVVAGLADVVVESTVRGAVRGSSVVGDAFRNVGRGLGDAVRACAEPLLRASAVQPFVVLRPKQGCTTCGNGNAQGKPQHTEPENANNNQNTINIILNGIPAQGITASSVPTNGTPANGNVVVPPVPTSPFQQQSAPPPEQTAPFTGQQPSQQAPTIIREIIREPVFVQQPEEKVKLVQRIKPQKIYIKRTKNNYVGVNRPTIETQFDTASISRNYAETEFDRESVVRPTYKTEFDTTAVNRNYADPQFDTETINRTSVDMDAIKNYLRTKKQQ